MRIIRIIIGVPLMLVGGYLALVSLVVGCATTQQGVANGSILTGVLWLQGMPTSIGEFVLGALGMLLIGGGYAIAAGGRRL